MHRSVTDRKQVVLRAYKPRGVSDGSEDAAVAEDDDGEGDEEDKGEEQHGVGADGRRERHVVPRAGRHQTLRDVGTCGRTHVAFSHAVM